MLPRSRDLALLLEAAQQRVHGVRVHGQELLVEDEKIEGTQRVSFEALDGGVRIALELDYALKDVGLLARASDIFFIRRAQSDSLLRTLLRFSRELADDLDPANS